MAPRNFHEIEKVRAKTQFGSGAHRVCECMNRKTQMRCKAVAVTGSKACRFHGGSTKLYRGGKKDKLPSQLERAYHASLAFSDDLGAYLEGHEPSKVAEVLREELVGARGRKLHELLNRDLNR